MTKQKVEAYAAQHKAEGGNAAQGAADDLANAPITGPTVTAPMPGNVLRFMVKAGDKVTRGQTVVILEAMKMENNIVATSDGQVKTIHVTVGQSVSQEDPLVELA